MSNEKEYRVRKSIASSIGEVSKIIGPGLTESDLLPIFDRLFREEAEIQNVLLKIMPAFLKTLSNSKRRLYLDKLKKLLNPREKWRTRKEFSRITGQYDSVFEEEVSYKQIVPICISFCLDDVRI